MAINKWIANGRLTKDSELRYTQEGKGILTFTLAVSRNYKNANGEYDADFIQCVLFGSTDQERCRATKLADYLNKGTLVNVEARMQSRSYENQDGQMVYVTEAVIEEIQLLSQPQEKQQPQRNTRSRQNNRR